MDKTALTCGVRIFVSGIEAHDESQVADKRYLCEATLALLNSGDELQQTIATTPALTA